MQARFIKDFAIALIVILLLAYAIRLFSINYKRNAIPDKSKYTNESVSDTLKTKIYSIESSIMDRKNFVFSITHDPLKQGNIIKDRFDRNKEFEDMVRNTFRPTGTYLDVETGRKLVTIEYQDKFFTGGVGDIIEGRKITRINENSIGIYYGGDQTLAIQPRPVMPDFNKEEDRTQVLDQNY
jgi:hypothetical protein